MKTFVTALIKVINILFVMFCILYLLFWALLIAATTGSLH